MVVWYIKPMSNILNGLLDRKQHAKELDLCGGNQSGNEIDLRRRESVSHGAEETSQHVDTNENWEGWRLEKSVRRASSSCFDRKKTATAPANTPTINSLLLIMIGYKFAPAR